ncbi:MAG: hypothetical protein ABIP94_19850 [Planctomycetota bacterium]
MVFFAMSGGLAMLGPMGVVAGPLIVSFFLVVVRALSAERRASSAAAVVGAPVGGTRTVGVP